MPPLLLSPRTCPVLLLEYPEFRSPAPAATHVEPHTATRSLLQEHNYQNVVSFTTARALLQYLDDPRFVSTNSVTVLLVDIDTIDVESSSRQSQDIEGLPLLSNIADIFKAKDLDVVLIALTSDTDSDVLCDCIYLGAEDVLVRPIETQVIKTLWLKVLRRRQKSVETPKAAESCLAVEIVTKSEKQLEPNSPNIVDRISRRISTLQSQTSHVTSLFINRATTDAIGRPVVQKLPTSACLTPRDHIFAALSLPDAKREKTRLGSLLTQWNFDPRQLESDTEIVRCVAIMLEHAAEQCGGLQAIGINQDTLHRFIVAVRSAYHADNPYHNFYHGVDVMQATYTFMRKMGILKTAEQDHTMEGFLHPHEAFAILIAALSHDLGHPGVNNAYMVSSKSALAELYNDVAVLENFHAAGLFALLRREEINFFGGTADGTDSEPSSRYRDFRRIVTSSILATDMAKHSYYVSRLKKSRKKFRPPTLHAQETCSDDDRTFLAGILIKCADISNPARPFPIAMQWSTSLLEEFDMQARVSKECKCSSKTGATNDCVLGEMFASVVDLDNDPKSPSKTSEVAAPEFLLQQPVGQIDFIDHFCRPLYDAVVGDEVTSEEEFNARGGGLARLEFCRSSLNMNREEWVRRRDASAATTIDEVQIIETETASMRLTDGETAVENATISYSSDRCGCSSKAPVPSPHTAVERTTAGFFHRRLSLPAIYEHAEPSAENLSIPLVTSNGLLPLASRMATIPSHFSSPLAPPRSPSGTSSQFPGNDDASTSPSHRSRSRSRNRPHSLVLTGRRRSSDGLNGAGLTFGLLRNKVIPDGKSPTAFAAEHRRRSSLPSGSIDLEPSSPQPSSSHRSWLRRASADVGTTMTTKTVTTKTVTTVAAASVHQDDRTTCRESSVPKTRKHGLGMFGRLTMAHVRGVNSFHQHSSPLNLQDPLPRFDGTDREQKRRKSIPRDWKFLPPDAVVVT